MELLQDPIIIALLGITALLVAITALIRLAVDIYLRNRRAQSNRAYMAALDALNGTEPDAAGSGER